MHPSSPSGPALEALVVLGCRVLADGTPSTALVRRVDRAAILFRSGLAPRVIMSGGRLWGQVPEADAMLARWIQLGLDPAAVVLERRSLTTRGNARCSAELLRAQGLMQVGLVTCDYHLPRALGHFAAEGLLVRGYAATVNRTRTQRLWLSTRELGARLLESCALGRSPHFIEEPHARAAGSSSYPPPTP